MRLLVDTHVFLWLHAAPERLGATLSLVEDEANEILVSAVTSWEIAIKHGLGRLRLPVAPAEYVPSRMAAIGAQGLVISHEHAAGVATLPHLHRDPFDRLLVSQARHERLTIVTADAEVAAYEVDSVVVDP